MVSHAGLPSHTTVAVIASVLLQLFAVSSDAAPIVIVGDSWGVAAKEPFRKLLLKRQSVLKEENIAVDGSTAHDWVHKADLQASLVEALSKRDVRLVWVSLMGNDAIQSLESCGAGGGTTEQCTERLQADLTASMAHLIQQIRSLAPRADIAGFGYDIPPWGEANAECADLPKKVFPLCPDTTCFNTNFNTPQVVWDALASNHTFVKGLNLLGTLQAAGGLNGTSPGRPDLSKFSPPSLYADCLHPTQQGFDLLLEGLYNDVISMFEPGAASTPSPHLPCEVEGANATEVVVRTGACVAVSCLEGYELRHVFCESSDDSGLSAGVIAAIGVSAAAVLAMGTVGIWCCCRRTNASVQDVEMKGDLSPHAGAQLQSPGSPNFPRSPTFNQRNLSSEQPVPLSAP